MIKLRSISFILAIGFISSSLLAQNPDEKVKISNDIPVLNENDNTKRKADFSEWYYWRDQLGAYTPVDGFRTSLFPDSNVLQVYGDGAGGVELGYAGLHSMGQVFDPKSDIWLTPLSEFNSYTIDSVAIPIVYNRFKDTEDKLIIQAYTGPTAVITGATTSGVAYARVDYDYNTNRGINATKTIEYDLTDNDTTSEFAWLSIYLGLEVKANELSAITVTYDPGYAWETGDTLWDGRFPSKNKLNHIQISYIVDENKYPDEGRFNMGLTIPKSVRYNTNENGWNGKYIPGSAWLNSNRHYNMQLYVTTSNLSKDEMNANNITAYPNPVSKSNGVLKVKSENDNIENVKLFGLTGQQYSISVINNNNTAEIDINNLSVGVYLLEITTNGKNTITKIQITE